MRIAVRFLQLIHKGVSAGAGAETLLFDGAELTFDGAPLTFISA